MHALGLEFGSAAQLSKRPGSVWNCLWGNALKRSPGIIRKSRVSYPGPGFLSSATWPSLPKKHYNGLNQTKYNIGWPWGAYKNILPEMLTILPESKTRLILLASRAIYSCIPRKRAIQYYYYYSYRALYVILLSNDRGWLPAAILSSHESERLWDVATVTKVGGA